VNIKEYLEYYPKTGIFKWIKSPHHTIELDSVAGTTNKRGYVHIQFNKKKYLAHRLAWFYLFGAWPKEIDHINGICDDNRIKNLRAVSHSINNRNSKLYKNNKLGYPGIRKHGSKWVAQIGGRKNRAYLGIYATWFDAVCAKKAAEYRLGYHVNHARANNRMTDRGHQ
jgi:hypothetical protein